MDDAYGKQFDEFFVGFEGSFGGMHVTPRSLSARFIGNLVCVEGIVTKCMLLCLKHSQSLPCLSLSSLFPLFSSLFSCFVMLGSLVRPKVVKSVHYCPATKKTIERKYSDLTSLDPFPSSSVYPTRVSLSRTSSKCTVCH